MTPVIFLFIIILSVPISGIAYAENHKTELKISTEKLVLNKITRLFGDPTIESAEFHITNISNKTATNINIFSGELSISSQTNPSIPNSQLNVSYIQVTPEYYPKLNYTDDIPVMIKLNAIPDTSAKYVGKIFVYGDNFKDNSVNVELVVKHDSFELVYSTIFGLGIAVFLGSVVSYRTFHNERQDAIKKKQNTIKERRRAINNINDHILNMNSRVDVIESKKWNAYKLLLESKNEHVEKHTDKFSPIDDVITKWYFSQEDKILAEPTSKPTKENKKISLIENPPYDVHNHAIIPKLAKKEIYLSNIMFAVGAMGVSIPTSLFAKDVLMGDPLPDVLIAIGIGFSIYRTKSIAELISKSIKRVNKT